MTTTVERPLRLCPHGYGSGVTAHIVGAQAPWVDAADLEGEVSLYDTRTGQALALNRTASDVWARADGRTSVDDLVSELAGVYAVDPDAIRDQVVSALDALAQAGVLVAP